MNANPANIDCLKQLLPANDGIDADASHREFLEQLRQVQAYPQAPSGDVEISGSYIGIWKKSNGPELQVTASLNAWNGSKHWTVIPQVQVLVRSEELKVSCKTALLAVVKVGTVNAAVLAERLMLLSVEGEAVAVEGIGHEASLYVIIKPFSGCIDDLLKASILVRLMATSERVASIGEKQRLFEGMLEELSEKAASVDVVGDLQELKAKLGGLQNAATDLEGKAGRMQMDIRIARGDHDELKSRVEDHGEQLRELRGGFSAVAFEATDIKLTGRKCELALEAVKGRVDVLVAENRRLSDAARTSQERADLQDRHFVELNRRIGDLRTAAERHEAALGRVKLLTYAMLAAFVAFFALLFAY